MAGLALYSATMTTNTHRAMKASSQVSEKNIVSSQIQHVLSKPDLCGGSLRYANGSATFNFGSGGPSPRAGFVDQIRVGSSPLLTVQPNANAFTATSIAFVAQPGVTLPDIDIETSPGVIVTHRQAMVHMTVSWQDRSPAGTRVAGARDHQQEFYLTVQAPAAGNINSQASITRCYASLSPDDTGTTAAQVCQDFGGVYDAAATPVKCRMTKLAIAGTQAQIQNLHSAHLPGDTGWLGIQNSMSVMGDMTLGGEMKLHKDMGNNPAVPNSYNALDLKATGTAATFYPRLNLRNERTNSNPLTRAGDRLGMIAFSGRNQTTPAPALAMNTPGSSDRAFAINVDAINNWTANQTGSRMSFESHSGGSGAAAQTNFTVDSNGDATIRRRLAIGTGANPVFAPTLQVRGTPTSNPATTSGELQTDGEIRFSHNVANPNGGGAHRGYVRGHGGDIELGSDNPNLSLVSLWNRATNENLSLRTRNITVKGQNSDASVALFHPADPNNAPGYMYLGPASNGSRAGRLVIRADSTQTNSRMLTFDAQHMSEDPDRQPQSGRVLTAANSQGLAEWRDMPGSGPTSRGCANPAVSVAGACVYINNDGMQEVTCPAGKIMIGFQSYHPPGDQGGHNFMGPICR